MAGLLTELRNAGFNEDGISAYMQEEQTKLKVAGFDSNEINTELGIDEDDSLMKNTVQELSEKKWEQAEDASPWESFLKHFEAPFSKKVAKSFMSVQSAKETGLAPHKFEPTTTEAIKAGWGQSVTGLLYSGKVPENIDPEYLNDMDRILFQASTLTGDLPFMTIGALFAAAGTAETGPGMVPFAMGGGFALPHAMRKVLMDDYQYGRIKDLKEFMARLLNTVYEASKGYATGFATGKAGLAVPPIAKLPAEVTTMVSIGAALEGEVPTAQDFADALILIGGFHFVNTSAMRSKSRKIYTETGKRPYEVVEDALRDPSILEDMMSENRVIPEAYAQINALARVPSVFSDNQRAFFPKPELLASYSILSFLFLLTISSVDIRLKPADTIPVADINSFE